MRIFFKLMLMLVAIALGLAVGFALRGKRTAKMAQSEEVWPTAKRIASSHRAAGTHFNDDSPLATQLERDLSMSSGVTRWLYWLQALEKAAPTDFPRLVRLAQNNPTALRFVAARWAEVAPRHMFETLIAMSKNPRGFPINELGNLLFREWARVDADGMIAALNEREDAGLRRTWREDAALSVCVHDPERGLRLMSEWHVRIGPLMTGITPWAAANPRHAAEFAFENSGGWVSEYVIEAIAKEWAKTDPAAALEFATGKRGQLASKLGTTVLKAWSDRNLNDAADWIASTDEQTRNRFGSAFVEVWAKQDASSALNWCQENLTGSSLSQAVGQVLQGAAQKDVAGAAGLVAAMEPSAARSEGAVAVAGKWFPGLASGKSVPSEAIAWLASLDNTSIRRVIEKAEWGWATSDPKSMAAFLAAASPEQVPSYADNILAREMARQNPLEALDWAGQLSGRRGSEAGSAAFGEWRSSQPDAAMAWLDQLPSNDPRRDSYFEGAIRTLAYDPRAAEQLAAMRPSERVAARNVIQTMSSLPEDRRTRLLSMLGAP